MTALRKAITVPVAYVGLLVVAHKRQDDNGRLLSLEVVHCGDPHRVLQADLTDTRGWRRHCACSPHQPCSEPEVHLQTMHHSAAAAKLALQHVTSGKMQLSVAFNALMSTLMCLFGAPWLEFSERWHCQVSSEGYPRKEDLLGSGADIPACWPELGGTVEAFEELWASSWSSSPCHHDSNISKSRSSVLSVCTIKQTDSGDMQEHSWSTP